MRNLAESNPTRVGLFRRTDEILEPLLDPGNLRYDPAPHGLLPAREALARRAALRGRPMDPGQFFLAASTSEAYSWLFKLLCDPGDAVLVPKPGYPLFDFLAGLEAVELRPYRLEYLHPRGWRVDIESLERALAAGGVKALVLINPNNPTGSYVAASERREILRLAARHGTALIVDEVFLDFAVEERSPESFLGEEEGVLCFVLDGLSKLLGLPQMKLGWIGASGPAAALREAVARLEIIADTYLSAGTPVMSALSAYLELAPAFGELLRGRLRANLTLLREELEKPDSPHRVLYCGGGWTALIEVPRFASEEELALGLLREEGILGQPGFLFDMEREAYFTASLLLESGELRSLIRGFRRFFESCGA